MNLSRPSFPSQLILVDGTNNRTIGHGWLYCNRAIHYYQLSLLNEKLGLRLTKTNHGDVRPSQDDSTMALWFIMNPPQLSTIA